MSYHFFVRILSTRNLLYRDYYGRNHVIPIGSVHGEVKAMSCHDAYFTLLQRVVEEHLEERNITRAKDLHYIQIAQFYSMILDYDILSSVDVYHGGKWLNMADLPPGNMYVKHKEKSKGTKKLLDRKKAGRDSRKKMKQFQLTFDALPRLQEPDEPEE